MNKMFMIILVRSLVIFGEFLLVLVCRKMVRKEAGKTMYSYRIMSIIGVMIFLAVNMASGAIRLWNFIRYSEYASHDLLYDIVSNISTAFTGVFYLAFIPVVLFGGFLLVANVVLFAKEGGGWRNTLGILAGVGLIVGSFGVVNLYNMLDFVFDVHSYAGFCLSLGIENVFTVLLVYFQCLMGATIFVSVKSMRHKPVREPEYVVVLGCYVRPDGTPGGVLRKRVEAALKFVREQKQRKKPVPTLVLSGGKGGDEPVTEAEAMRRFLEARRYMGRVLIEDKSKTTRENFRFSKEVIRADRGMWKERVAFATTDFHVFRSGVIMSQLGFEHPEGIAAKSPWYFYYNALIREFIANIQAEWRLHLLNLSVVVGVMSLYVWIGYVFDVL